MRRHRGKGEAGDITVFVAVIAIALFLVIGLVIDGGRYIHTSQLADNAAAEAARAGGQHITGHAVLGEAPQVNTDLAVEAAQAYLLAAGVDGTVTISGDTITVTTTTTSPPVLLSMVGVPAITADGAATVRLATD